MRSLASVVVLPIACALFLVAVYFPDAGRGFIKDDFTWIRTARSAIAHPRTLIRQPEAGFYRPVVTLAFAFDYAVHGWKPRGYGWTNLGLCIACALALGALALALGLPRRAALLAAVLWTINPHGINMALLWLSGRTATLLTLFSLLTAVAFLRRRYGAAALLLALALLSKEEAVLLPFILLAWGWIRDRGVRPPWTAIVALFAPLAVYLYVRALTPAMTPATAPSFYRFTFDPLLVLRNAGEYLDRSATLATAGLVCAMIAYRARAPDHGGGSSGAGDAGGVVVRDVRDHHLAARAVEPVRGVPVGRGGTRQRPVDRADAHGLATFAGVRAAARDPAGGGDSNLPDTRRPARRGGARLAADARRD